MPSLRTRMSRTYVRGDGSFRTVASPVPVNYRDGQGRWTPIDDRLVRQPSGAIGVAADSYAVQVPATAAAPLVASQGPAVVSMRLRGASATAAAAVAGSTATYPNALPGADLLVSTRAGSVDQTLRLRSPSAPASYTYDLSVPAGYSLRPEPDRSLSLVDGTGKTVAALPAPVLRDSSGDPDRQTSTGVRYEVTGAAPSYTVTVAADKTWLADPERVFPVLLVSC
ncbi:MAG TPA: hypothetical protein VGP36_13135 [Mycobacteriales bacterium]|nr:hypothetical protein [Mycobacteriales bacterium]